MLQRPPASASVAERYLAAWRVRDRDSGWVFARGVDAAGQSSFERLAAASSSATALVDRACGSGRLLQLCERSNPSALKIGIDASRTELQRAAG
jgi:hypothetical protein